MKNGHSSLLILTAVLLSVFMCFQAANGSPPPPPSGEVPILAADTVYVDDFNRVNGPLGVDWVADSTMLIVSNELDNTDTSSEVDDIAVYSAHSNPLGVAMKWSQTADSAGIDKGGLALRLSGTNTNSNGYYIFKNEGDNKYALWTVDNGAITTKVTTASSALPYPAGGEEFQIVIRSDGGGHHFDLFYNNQFDLTITDPYKLQGNGSILYSGILLGGAVNNTVDEFTFVQYDDDTTPPAAISDLEAIPLSGSSIKLRWTAPGDDGASGTAGSYDVRFATFPIDDISWSYSIKFIGESQPSGSGSKDSITVQNLLPETEYYFAVKTSDGFPKNNISGLSNVVTGQTVDDIPPSQITNLTVIGAGSRTALLSWTAPGDSDTSGTATTYDVRFSTSPITDENFNSALRGTGEPDPLPYGSYQEYTLNKLRPNTSYHIAVRTSDERNNKSLVSNNAGTTTTLYPWANDLYERTVLGDEYWDADPELQIVDGEFENVSTEDRWDFAAIFQPATDLKEVEFRWGDGVDLTGTGSSGLLLMMDAPDPAANGYLIFRNPTSDKIALWNVSNGVPSTQIAAETGGSDDPGAGDRMRVVLSTDMNGNHFDYWINGDFDVRVSDPNKVHAFSGTKYSGVMLHSNRNNNVESFSLASPESDLPPARFSLFMPFNGDTVDVGDPLLNWYDSFDLNGNDSVFYDLWYTTDSTYQTNYIFVDSIYESEYRIPGGQLGRMLANYLTLVSDSDDASDTPRLSGEDVNSVTELPDDTKIFWKVRAMDTTLRQTLCDQTDWGFFVMIPDAPMPFGLVSPEDGVTVGTRNPTLVWHTAVDPDPDAEGIRYEVWYDRAPDFAHPTVIGGLADTSFTLPTLLNFETYYWKVSAEDEDSLVTFSNAFFSFHVDTTFVGVEDETPSTPELPKMYTLGQNYPNPFNPRTSISYNVPESIEGEVQVTMDVYNVRGVKVKTLVSGMKSSGRYIVGWDGTDDSDREVSSGIYFYRMKAGDFISTKKMVILK